MKVSSPGSSTAVCVYTRKFLAGDMSDPLGVRTCIVAVADEWSNGKTFRELFEKAVGADAKKYEILQIVRVFNFTDPKSGAFWYSYIEREKLNEKELSDSPVGF